MRTDTRRRLNSHAADAASEFDSELLHNRVYEQVQGQHGDHDLRRCIDLTEEAYDFANARERSHGHTDDVHRAAFDAARTIERQIETLREAEITAACRAVIHDAPGWGDAWDDSEIHAAIQEAKTWLNERDLAYTEGAMVNE